MSGQPPKLELEDPGTTKIHDEESTIVFVPNYGEKNEPTGFQSATHTESELPATAPQHRGGDPQSTSDRSNSSSINESGEERFHQRAEAPCPPSSTRDDRDLERGEPSAPISPVSLVAAGQGQEEGHTETAEATAWKVTEQSNGLVQFLESELGERKYREYAMGYGDTVHHSFLVRNIIGNIAAWSSSKETWRPLKYLATISQHLVSRWVHSGYQKHFETLHPHLYDGTAVHLIQNIGNPSDRWINEILKESLGLDPLFLLEHLALICDGTPTGLTSTSKGSVRSQCNSAWHVRAVLSDQPMFQFGPWSTSAPLEKTRVATISFQQTGEGSFLVLLNMATSVPLGERLQESFRARDTLERTWSKRRSFFARTTQNTFAGLWTIATMLYLLLQVFTFTLFPVVPLWWLITTLIFLRPVDPNTIDRYGEVAIEWPDSRRTYLRRELSPPEASVFYFLEAWLSDPVHIKMLTYMTSKLTHDANAYKIAEDRCIWLLNRADWRYEVRLLSTESEVLERHVVEKSNFNTLRRLVKCRKTTKRVKDGINIFRSYTPAATGDWTPIIQSWADQQQARSDQQRRQQANECPQQDEKELGATLRLLFRRALASAELHQSQTNFFPTVQAEKNPIELLYWGLRMGSTWEPEETADLTLDHVEETLSRSLSLLQNAIAVQTSDRALWLALIATFYFPATLATGIFGMNLSLIDGKPYWWAIVVCAIMFVLNLGLLIYVFGRR